MKSSFPSSSVSRTFSTAVALGLSLSLSACGTSGSDADIQYAALGASDATGIGADPLTNGYVYLIEDNLQARGATTSLTNFGIPTADVDEINRAAQAITRLENPDLITVFTGANDISGGMEAAEFRSELHDMLRHLQDNTDAFIVIGTLPDISKLPAFQENPKESVTSARVAQFNSIIVSEAAEHGVAVADLSDLQNSGELTDSDGFHPNNAGYRRIADRFISVIDAHFFGSSAPR